MDFLGGEESLHVGGLQNTRRHEFRLPNTEAEAVGGNTIHHTIQSSIITFEIRFYNNNRPFYSHHFNELDITSINIRKVFNFSP